MAKREVTTAVSKVVRRLRERALSTEPGQLIGSEDQLVATYGVSRPTLRQAAALVGQEQLLFVRRGVGGGYLARRPDTHAVANMAAIYLQSRQARLSEILRAIQPIKGEMSALAAANRDPDVLSRWREFQERDLQAEREGGYREFLRSEREFSRLLGAACGNRVLELFVETLYDFCATIRPEEDLFRDRPERVHEYWSRREMLVTAIINGDAEVAALTATRLARLANEWTVKDVGGNPPSDDGGEQAFAFRLAAS